MTREYFITRSSQITPASSELLRLELHKRGGLRLPATSFGAIRHNYLVDQMRSELKDRDLQRQQKGNY